MARENKPCSLRRFSWSHVARRATNRHFHVSRWVPLRKYRSMRNEVIIAGRAPRAAEHLGRLGDAESDEPGAGLHLQRPTRVSGSVASLWRSAGDRPDSVRYHRKPGILLRPPK